MILICAKQEFSSNSSGNLLAAEYADAEDCCTGQFTITLIIPFFVVEPWPRDLSRPKSEQLWQTMSAYGSTPPTPNVPDEREVL
jgi:hypothetical protein